MCLLLEQKEILGVELVFAELLRGSKTKREKDIISQYWLHLPKLSMDTVFIEASKVSRSKKWFSKGVGLIDCAILHYARKANAKLWTIDKKLLGICEDSDMYHL